MQNFKYPNLMDWETGKVKGFSAKNLINLKNGGFKMVKINPYSEYPSHLHPNKTEFIYVLEGSPNITIAENNYDGKKGDFFILPISIKHGIGNPNSTECILLIGAINN